MPPIAKRDNQGIFDAMPSEIEKLLVERDRLLAERDELRALVAKQFQDLASLRTEMRQGMAEIEREHAHIKRLMRDIELMRADIAANRDPLKYDFN
jgi:hypothetical protein